MVETGTWKERKWLFTNQNDVRGNLFSKVGYTGYGAQTPTSGSRLYDTIMTAQNYDTKEPGMLGTDIHYEFTDMVVIAAFYNRAIDKPAGTGTQLGKAQEALRVLVYNTNVESKDLDTKVEDYFKKSSFTDPLDVLKVKTTDLKPAFKVAAKNKKTSIQARLKKGETINETVERANLYDILTAILKRTVRPQYGGQFTDLTNSNAKEFYENVYLKWGKDDQTTRMDDDTRNFYRAFVNLQTLSGGDWKNVTEAEYMNPISNYNNYRINFKKTGERTLFGEAFPRLSLGVFNAIWYTDKSGNRLTIAASSVNSTFFSDLYNEIYNLVDSKNQTALTLLTNPVTTFAEATSTLTIAHFSQNKDKVTRRRLFAIAKAPVVDVIEEEEKQYVFQDMYDGNIWARDDKGSYVKKLEDGTTIKFGVNDPKTVDMLKASHKCYGTLINDTGADCQEYVWKCLLEDNEDNLKQCILKFKKKDFYKEAKNEISAMHPIIACRTLQRFGFRTHKVYDTYAGTTLRKVETVNHWLKSFGEKHFGKKEIQEMKNGNESLLAYLNLVSQYVNANPNILNKGLEVISEEGVGITKPTDFAKALGLKPRKQPSRRDAALYEMKLFRRHFDQYSRRGLPTPFQVRTDGRVYTPFGLSVTPNVTPMILQRMGQFGGSSADWAIRKIYGSSAAEPVVGARFIGLILTSLISELENRGKKINPTDQANLKERVKKLESNEKELVKLIVYIEEYNKLLDAFGDYSQKTLSIDELKQLIERQGVLGARHIKQEGSLLGILEQLQKLVGEDGGDYQKIENCA